MFSQCALSHAEPYFAHMKCVRNIRYYVVSRLQLLHTTTPHAIDFECKKMWSQTMVVHIRAMKDTRDTRRKSQSKSIHNYRLTTQKKGTPRKMRHTMEKKKTQCVPNEIRRDGKTRRLSVYASPQKQWNENFQISFFLLRFSRTIVPSHAWHTTKTISILWHFARHSHSHSTQHHVC